MIDDGIVTVFVDERVLPEEILDCDQSSNKRSLVVIVVSVDKYNPHRNEPDDESPSFLILVLILLESPASAEVQDAER